jgi:hypothetical protein
MCVEAEVKCIADIDIVACFSHHRHQPKQKETEDSFIRTIMADVLNGLQCIVLLRCLVLWQDNSHSG